MPLCDSVLRLAALGLFEAYWSEVILTEVGRTLAKFGKSEAQIKRRLSQMRQAFPEAIVEGFEFLIPAMTNDEKDRHVLAAAVRAGVNQVVTQNTRDFPQESADQYEIEIRNPDEFLMNVVDLYPKQTLIAIREQSEALRRENALDAVIAKLAMQVPQFAQAIDTLVRAGA
jgi:predicted nucleic acid-binding protein